MPACTRHVHRGPEDFRPDGRCVHCSRENQSNYRRGLREAREQLDAIRAALQTSEPLEAQLAAIKAALA